MHIALKISFTMLLVLISPASAFAEETIRLATGEWPPYYSKDLKHNGLALRIITEAFALEGIKVEFEFYPWARGLLSAERGTVDGAATWTATEEREKLFYASDPVFEGEWVFFHLKSFPFNWETYDDLKGIDIGGTLEYDYGDDFKNAEAAKKIVVQRVPKDEQNFDKILFGRIKIFPQFLDVGYYQLQELYKPEDAHLFTHHPKPLKVVPSNLLLSKKLEKNKRLIVLFNRGLRQLKETGKYDQYILESRRGEYRINKSSSE